MALRETHMQENGIVRSVCFLMIRSRNSVKEARSLPVGTRLICGDVVLEITQIGKECHHGCAIFQKMGECIMPREGVFARVIRGGVIRTGDEMKVAAHE